MTGRAADFYTLRWMWKADGSHYGVRAANPAIKTTKLRSAKGCLAPAILPCRSRPALF
jgi:hypothetical protein